MRHPHSVSARLQLGFAATSVGALLFALGLTTSPAVHFVIGGLMGSGLTLTLSGVRQTRSGRRG